MTRCRPSSIVVSAALVFVIAGCGREATPAQQQPASKAQPVVKNGEEADPPAPSTKKVSDAKPAVRRVALVKAAAAAQPIAAARPVQGTLSRTDDRLADGSFVDYYTYTGTRGEQLTITLRSKQFDAYLLVGAMRNGVFDPDQDDDDSGGGTDAKIQMTLPSNGPLTIAANSFDEGKTGDYTLEVASTAAAGGGAGGAGRVATLQIGTLANGRLENGDNVMSRDKTLYDYWTFEGAAGQRVVVTMKSSAFDAYLILKRGAPGRADSIGEDDDSGGGVDARLTATLPETGTYTVVANAAVPGTGSYTLIVEVADAPAAANNSAGVPYADRYRGGGDPNDKYALVIGIDDYPGTASDLRGPRADARLFADLLTKKFAFKPANVVVLLDGEATRQHILTAFIRHLGQAGPQGSAVFYYSGHGTQMEENLALTAPLDNETDGRDEALYVWGSDSRSSVILDDEIGYMIDHLNTQKVLLVHDSCNSGTTSRGLEAGQSKTVALKRVLPELFLPRTLEVGAPKQAMRAGPGSAGGWVVGVAEATGPHALLAASKDEELSYTASGWPDRGGIASVFTYYLVGALEGAEDRATFSQIMDRVRAQTVDYTRRTYKEVQTPQMGGTLASRSIGSVLR